MTDYSELVKALTCGNDEKLPCHNNECPYWVDKWHGIGLCNVIIKDEDAAAAIEALQKDLTTLQTCYEIADATVDAVLKQLPKRGKWINSKERMRPDMCSVCGCIYEADRFMDKIAWNYCPNCGAKMEVQDGTD